MPDLWPPHSPVPDVSVQEADEFTVVAWDAPGFGGSSDPPEPFRLSDFADEQRLQQALRLADLSPELVDELIATLFTDSAPADLVDDFAATVREFHPAGLRAASRAFAEADLRDVLPRIAVPTVLLYGDRDVRAPLNVAHDLRAKIPGSRLAVMAHGTLISGVSSSSQCACWWSRMT